ncbi:DERL1 [Mytilus coruscus]|uniref:Derlin n=1 Tax=Mytilus coruscus TaxID=42192 RepID=A0A6J8D825_MYTCO|nr:DERL1 [Mytilus coruscus]
MSSNDIGDWYRSIPKITKWWFSGSVVIPIAAKLGLLNPMWLFLHYESLIYKFQFWRPLTAVLFYPTGFPYLINLYFLYSYSTRIETGIYDGKPAEYAFMWLFNWLALVIIGLVAEIYLLMDPMVLSVLYVWCQLNKDQIVQFWFGTQFKAIYLPWVLFAFNAIIGSGGLAQLLGIVVGHLYFFLMFKYPQDFGGARMLRVPAILYKWLPNRRGGMSGFGQAPASRRQDGNDNANGGGHVWGRGNALGD